MQKIDYIDDVKELTALLKSEEIVGFIESLPSDKAIDTQKLTPLLVESKSNFNKLETTDKKMNILNALNGNDFYSEENIANLINASVQATVQQLQKVALFSNSEIIPFYNLHKNLIAAKTLAIKILLDDNEDRYKDQAVIIFRVLIENQGLNISIYTKILTLLGELIETIAIVKNQEKESRPQVVLFDTGSDANIGIKSTVEVAKSLFQIFKEIWDWLINKKFYENKLKNSALLENIEVLNVLDKAQNEGTLKPEQAKIYREIIMRRTEDLLDLKVVPKELIENKTIVSGYKVLSEYSEVKLLEEKKV